MTKGSERATWKGMPGQPKVCDICNQPIRLHDRGASHVFGRFPVMFSHHAACHFARRENRPGSSG